MSVTLAGTFPNFEKGEPAFWFAEKVREESDMAVGQKAKADGTRRKQSCPLVNDLPLIPRVTIKEQRSQGNDRDVTRKLKCMGMRRNQGLGAGGSGSERSRKEPAKESVHEYLPACPFVDIPSSLHINLDSMHFSSPLERQRDTQRGSVQSSRINSFVWWEKVVYLKRIGGERRRSRESVEFDG
ncbi:hypothetical protein BD410DRAFT_803603 [Rickenella mellea]|uniref:Uncharacterized protein n=1 Tax=Rickenella mellea TaxID=50990 RepID=A0A4Y7Q6L9_9AGAM|nr:hypothetical protein BD410DRAFT_803603 [Rickenella mellea]